MPFRILAPYDKEEGAPHVDRGQFPVPLDAKPHPQEYPASLWCLTASTTARSPSTR